MPWKLHCENINQCIIMCYDKYYMISVASSGADVVKSLFENHVMAFLWRMNYHFDKNKRLYPKDHSCQERINVWKHKSRQKQVLAKIHIHMACGQVVYTLFCFVFDKYRVKKSNCLICIKSSIIEIINLWNPEFWKRYDF